MFTLNARNANQALPEMMYKLQNSLGDVVKRPSRNGEVLQFMQPVAIHYGQPKERVVFWPERDANPFFHLLESLWMIAGRNDVAYVAQFSGNIAQFSDDGKTFHGAYGHRWRRHFCIEGEAETGIGMIPTCEPIDQLLTIAAALKENPDDRRQVLQMWDAKADLGLKGKDLPCNLMITFQRDHTGALNMVVYNRSNDIVWGALGANCVHMSYLQEYMAARIGCEVGWYEQVSANMHGYTKTVEPVKSLADKAFPSKQHVEQDPYATGAVVPFRLVNIDIRDWDTELRMFLSEPFALGYREPFFRKVAGPMVAAYRAFKQQDNQRRFVDARQYISCMAECDWKLACFQWLARREEAAARRAQEAAAAATSE